MKESVDRRLDRRWQYAAYVAFSLLTLVFGVILLYLPGAYFHQFFGETNPILVIDVASGVGVATLWTLQSSYEFVILEGGRTLRGVALSAALATALAVAIVTADFIFRYPQNINVPVPQALLFYPAIGFVAEIAFHVLPLALLLLVMKPLEGRLRREHVIWLGILLVAAIEPTFQVLFEGMTLTWIDAYTWIHVFAISILQLYVFWHFDFVSMYAFRLIYYMYWHILWGTARLDVLF